MPTATVTIDPTEIDAVVFDMDGVLTATARVHAKAWKAMFDEYLEQRAEARGETFRPFDIEDDYRPYVDGKPRHDGVRSFLASRGIELAEGEPSDGPQSETIRGLGHRKNQLFLELLRRDGAERFDDAVALVHALADAKVGSAVISSSRNAREVLEQAGIEALFATRVDGVVADEEGLAGKPAPDVFLEAARRLGAEPARSIVVEDAVAGVEAGRAGGFARVIGVAREGGDGARQRLSEAGADVVVTSLSEIAVAHARREQGEHCERGDRENRETDDDGGRTIDGLPSALEALERVAGDAAGRELVLFLDFDGTLAPIVDRPEAAALAPETKDVLADVAARRKVAIVSGRDLDDLRERVGLDDVYYAGSHGYRLAGPDGWHREYEPARRFRPILDEVAERLRKELESMEGVQVERKHYAIAVHVRRAPEGSVDRVRGIVGDIDADCPELRLGEGRKVFELRPALDWDKGKAVGWLLDAMRLDTKRAYPIYIGDDVTDEDAFREVEPDGLAIAVRGRSGPTRARLGLEDPAAVRTFISRLDSCLEKALGSS